MGDSFQVSTERTLSTIRAELNQLKRDYRGASVYGLAGASPGPNIVINVHMVAHGWSLNQVVGFVSGVWALATVNPTYGWSFYSSLGVIGKVVDADNVLVVVRGLMSIPGVSDHTDYYVDELTPGGYSDLAGGVTNVHQVFVFRSYENELVWVDGQTTYFERYLVSCLDVDVDPATIASGDTLSFDGTKWVNVAPGAASFGVQTANRIFAGPATGVPALPTFRDMVMDDLPTLFAWSVVCNPTNASAKPTSISAATTGEVLVMGATTLIFDTIDTASFKNLAVTTAKIDNLAVTTGKIALNAVTTAQMDALITAGGPTGAAGTVPVITWDASGRLTAVSTATITPGAIGAATAGHTHTLTGDVTGTVTGATTISALAVQTGMIALLAVTSAQMSTTGVTAGTYGDASNVAQITVDAAGRITSVLNVPVSGSGAVALDDLTDVIITSPATDDILFFNGSDWVNGLPAIALDDLSDVVITTPADGDVLTYDLGSGHWINVAAGAAAFGAQTANKIFAGPASGIAALPTFRDAVMDDLPTTFGNSVIGNDTAGAAKPGNITAVTTGQVLVMGATVISWDTLDTASYKNDSVTYAKIQNVSATDVLLGRQTAGAGDIEEIPCTAYGRSLIADANATAARATLALGTMAVENSNAVSITGGTITGITDLAVADGGTGASTAIGALYNLITDPIEFGTRTDYNTLGSFTHTFAVGSKFFLARLIGSGGGGAAGAGSTISAAKGGGGGGAGATVWIWARIPGGTTTAAVSIGNVGGGGASPNGAGGNGNACTLTLTLGVSYTFSAGGGFGAPGSDGRGGLGGKGSVNHTGYEAVGRVIFMSGENGHPCAVSTVAYNGTGNIALSGLSYVPGIGGQSHTDSTKGDGGGGSTPGGGNGGGGNLGAITIWEA